MAPPAVDAKAKADVKVDAPPPPPAPEPKPEAKAEVKADAKPEASPGAFKLDYKSAYVEGGPCMVWRGFQNNSEDSHFGACGGFTIGYPTLRFGEGGPIYLRIPELTYRREGVSRSIPAEFGQGIESSANIDSILFGTTFGVNILKYLGVELGFGVGPSHIGATAEDNGKKGIRYHDNRFAYSADNWGISYEGRLGITFPTQQLTSWLAMGGKIYGAIGKSDWQLVPDSISRPPSDPEIPVGSGYKVLGASLTFTLGETSPARGLVRLDSETRAEPAPEDKPVAPAPAAAPAAAPVPAGVKAIQDMVEPMKTDVAKVMATEPAKNAAGYAQIATDGVKQKKVDKSMVKDATDSAVGEYRRAAAGYKAATEKVAQADAALAELKKDTTLKPEQIKLAEEAVAAMKAEADKLKEETGKAYKSASDAVKAYNGIKGLPKKEKIEFTDKDPTAPAEAPKPAKPAKPEGAVK